MKFALMSLLLAVAQQQCCGTNTPDPLGCVRRFELSGGGADQKLFDADGQPVAGIELEVSPCQCSEVRIEVKHREGAELTPPTNACIGDRSPAGASIWFTARGCDFSYALRPTEPPTPIPIKVRP